jgi:hypothetical protein
MKNTRNKYFKTICSIGIIFAITCTTSLSAQGIPGGVDPPVEGEGGDAIPLDGGLAILLIGAAAFGIKKLRDNKKGNI